MAKSTYDISAAMVDRFRKAIAQASKDGHYSDLMNRRAVTQWLDDQGFCGKRPILTLAQAFASEIENKRGADSDPWNLCRLLEMVASDLTEALRVKDAVSELLFSVTDTIEEVVWESPRAHARD